MSTISTASGAGRRANVSDVVGASTDSARPRTADTAARFDVHFERALGGSERHERSEVGDQRDERDLREGTRPSERSLREPARSLDRSRPDRGDPDAGRRDDRPTLRRDDARQLVRRDPRGDDAAREARGTEARADGLEGLDGGDDTIAAEAVTEPDDLGTAPQGSPLQAGAAPVVVPVAAPLAPASAPAGDVIDLLLAGSSTGATAAGASVEGVSGGQPVAAIAPPDMAAATPAVAATGPAAATAPATDLSSVVPDGAGATSESTGALVDASITGPNAPGAADSTEAGPPVAATPAGTGPASAGASTTPASARAAEGATGAMAEQDNAVAGDGAADASLSGNAAPGDQLTPSVVTGSARALHAQGRAGEAQTAISSDASMSVTAVAPTGSAATGDGESDASSTGGGQPAPSPAATGDRPMVGSFTAVSAADANGADGSASSTEQADTTGTGRPGEPSVGTRNGELLRTPGLDRMSIDLSDEGLGPLTLQAANGVGGLQLRLTAGDRAVGEALAASAHELRSELEASGTALGSLDVGHRDTPGHRHGPNDDRLASGRADRLVAPATPTATATRAISATRPVGSGSTGLDLRI